MAYSPETKKMILDFLRDNPKLSSYEVSDALNDLGIYVSYGTLAKYRRENNIDFDGRVSVAKRLKADLDAGIPMPTSDQIMKKYKCCRSHANKCIRDALGVQPKRKQKKVVVAANAKVAQQMKVNTFAHLVSQLTANDDGRRVA
jgi:hypothetical protein